VVTKGRCARFLSFSLALAFSSGFCPALGFSPTLGLGLGLTPASSLPLLYALFTGIIINVYWGLEETRHICGFFFCLELCLYELLDTCAHSDWREIEMCFSVYIFAFVC
jgi:hypothetical protein